MEKSTVSLTVALLLLGHVIHVLVLSFYKCFHQPQYGTSALIFSIPPTPSVQVLPGTLQTYFRSCIPEGFLLVQFTIPSSLFKEFPTSSFFLKLLPMYQTIDVFRVNILKLLVPVIPIYSPLQKMNRTLFEKKKQKLTHNVVFIYN